MMRNNRLAVGELVKPRPILNFSKSREGPMGNAKLLKLASMVERGRGYQPELSALFWLHVMACETQRRIVNDAFTNFGFRAAMERAAYMSGGDTPLQSFDRAMMTVERCGWNVASLRQSRRFGELHAVIVRATNLGRGITVRGSASTPARAVCGALARAAARHEVKMLSMRETYAL
jgi:hypothetical protein